MSTNRFQLVQERVAMYERHVDAESWQPDHHNALICFDFAEVISEGVNEYNSLCRLDAAVRSLFYRGDLDYNPELEQMVNHLFARWLTSSEKAIGLFERFESDYARRGFDGALVEKLRSACLETRSAMVDDAEFFSNDATFDAAKAALIEDDAGETTDIEDILGSRAAPQ